MGLGVFYNDLRGLEGFYQRLTAKELGVFLVSNGVYHAVLKENGKPSPVLEKNATFYVLKEDLQTRGFNEGEVDRRVKVITYDDLVDLIMDKYEKLAWL
ncbi:MAG: sulfurtransferase complex subunit TusB [Nitrospirota bacterium]